MHSAIIVLSTTKPEPEDLHGIGDNVFECNELPDMIDYIGQDYSEKEARHFLSLPSELYSVSADHETLTPMDKERFFGLYIENLKEAVDKLEDGSDNTTWLVRAVAEYGSEGAAYRWVYVDGEFYTLRGLIENYGGQTLYILGVTDYHV